MGVALMGALVALVYYSIKYFLCYDVVILFVTAYRIHKVWNISI